MSKPTIKMARTALGQALAQHTPTVEPAVLVATAVRIMSLLNRSIGVDIDSKDPWVQAAMRRVLAAAAEFRDMLRRL